MDDGPISHGLRPRAVGRHTCELPSGGRRLLVSSIAGVRADGTIEKGLRAQLERMFQNLIETTELAGYSREQIARIAVVVTEPGRFALYQEVKARKLPGLACLDSYRQVAGLSSPSLLCEVDAEIVAS